MKRVYVNEQWCLGCHLCEYYCAFANSHINDMVKALKGREIYPNIQIEEKGDVSFAVSCRHCSEPLCVKSCITGALSIKDGVKELTAINASAALPACLSVPTVRWCPEEGRFRNASSVWRMPEELPPA